MASCQSLPGSRMTNTAWIDLAAVLTACMIDAARCGCHGRNVIAVDAPGQLQTRRRTYGICRRCYLNSTPCNCETQGWPSARWSSVCRAGNDAVRCRLHMPCVRQTGASRRWRRAAERNRVRNRCAIVAAAICGMGQGIS